MICYYHNDADGMISAAWVYLLSKSTFIDNFDNKFIEVSYKDNENFPIDVINKDEDVFIVDFSVNPETMDKILEITTHVNWIDHHETAIDMYADYPVTISGLREIGIAGCELTRIYIEKKMNWCAKNGSSSGCTIPKTLSEVSKYIGDRDVWKFEYPETKDFYAGYETVAELTPLTAGILLDAHGVDGLIKIGKIINAYKRESRLKACRFAYESTYHVTCLGDTLNTININSHRCLICNSTDKTSELFGDRFKDYDFVAIYVFDGDSYNVSLYSDEKIAVNVIAKIYGGGGHRYAAGFECKVLPSWLVCGDHI